MVEVLIHRVCWGKARVPRARPLNPKKGEGARGGTADSVFASNRTHRTCTRCVVVVRMCQGGVPGVSLNGGGVKRHRGIGIDTKRPRRLRCGVEAGGDTRGSYRGRKTVISLKGRDGSVPLVVADGDGVTEMGADGVWWEWARRPMDGDRVWGRRGRRRNGSGMSISADGGAACRAFPLATQSVRGRRGPVRMPAGPWGSNDARCGGGCHFSRRVFVLAEKEREREMWKWRDEQATRNGWRGGNTGAGCKWRNEFAAVSRSTVEGGDPC